LPGDARNFVEPDDWSWTEVTGAVIAKTVTSPAAHDRAHNAG
jgi:hypothetical protein